ncbi:aldose epimerase family protein [Rhodococcus sp. SORGH_AS_0303]|uniref:aldose epimerase family protein n=1 Tax=Rhodococcus sp. SORGH_AS_0303 TaxID=3041753 RepID=UPI00277D6013|nr:aldose epimerase family protein [Rhodococcus sp. SORGH_AS_0303]MDQ1202180.1 aldose 1-epimerase [Rhodococcus sp. SORGH_AS_0303]
MTTDRTSDTAVTIGSAPGIEVEVLPYGATLLRLTVTGGDGVRRDVSVGVAGEAELRAGTDYLGATVGRYANRIAHGRFDLDGERVEVSRNDGDNHLHGGVDGFDSRTWTVERVTADEVELSLVSPDGDQGYPGEVRARAVYSVQGDTMRIEYLAQTSRTTVVNLTSHAYIDLDGHGVDDLELQVDAASFVPVDSAGIPTNGVVPVDGTALDLRLPRRIGDVVRSDDPHVAATRGVDHNFVLDGPEDGGELRRAARVTSHRSDTTLEVWTNRPGLQVYTGNFLDGITVSRRGTALCQGDGLALEPQFFPDSPNRPAFPSAVLRPGETSRCVIEYRFAAR